MALVGSFCSNHCKITGTASVSNPLTTAGPAAKQASGTKAKTTLKILCFDSTHPKEMSNSDGKANGQGGGSQVVLPALIGGSKDAQDQLEGEEELDGHCLPRRRLVMQLEGEEKHLRDRQVWWLGWKFGGGTNRDIGNR